MMNIQDWLPTLYSAAGSKSAANISTYSNSCFSILISKQTKDLIVGAVPFQT
jgi:hypothetical protein